MTREGGLGGPASKRLWQARLSQGGIHGMAIGDPDSHRKISPCDRAATFALADKRAAALQRIPEGTVELWCHL
jgi:hypothetical protein